MSICYRIDSKGHGQRMNKQEFINKLRAALNGRISPEQVNENVNYYEEYINTQIRMGNPEEQVLATLGDPRLIARTIIETAGQSGQNAGYNGRTYNSNSGYNSNNSYNNAYSGGYQQNSSNTRGAYGNGYQNGNYNSNGGGYQHYQNSRTPKTFRMPGWLWAIIVILVLVMVFSALFSVVSFLLPVLFPILLVVFLVKLFRDWLN